jgi:hypothetical protein
VKRLSLDLGVVAKVRGYMDLHYQLNDLIAPHAYLVDAWIGSKEYEGEFVQIIFYKIRTCEPFSKTT